MMSREGTGFNEITAHVIDALKDSGEPLKYGVPGWIPDEVRKQVDLRPTREVCGIVYNLSRKPCSFLINFF